MQFFFFLDYARLSKIVNFKYLPVTYLLRAMWHIRPLSTSAGKCMRETLSWENAYYAGQGLRRSNSYCYNDYSLLVHADQ